MDTLAAHIRARREALNLRQDAVGFHVGKGQSWYSRLEAGELRNMPDPETFRALACVLKTSVADLLEAAGYLTPEDRAATSVNPFAVDDPRWALVETLKAHEVTDQQAEAIGKVVMLMTEKSGVR